MEPSATLDPRSDLLSDPPVRPAPESYRPIDLSERIHTMDLVRGMALLGILMMNIPYFGQAPQLETEPYFRPASTDYTVFGVITILFEGKMRALFSMLFGAGLLIFTSRKEAAGLPSADLFYRRLLWMVLFGTLHAYVLLWSGDVLFDYAIAGLFLFVFRNLKPRQLLIAALVCLAVLGLKNTRRHVEMKSSRAKYLTAVSLEKGKKKLTDEQKKDKEAWVQLEKRAKPDPKEVAEMNKNMRSGYLKVYKTLEPHNIRFDSTFLYLFIIWDVFGMMFLGMALFKWGFFQNRLPARTYWLTLAGGYGIGLPLAVFHFFLGQQATTAPAQFADNQFFPKELFYDLERGLMALGHASLLLLMYRTGVFRWLWRGIANVGQMAFSNYILQTLCCSLFFYGFGLSYFGKLAYHQLFYVVAGVWTINLIFSAVWLRFFRFGPLEWAWRSLTYWQRQPWRKN